MSYPDYYLLGKIVRTHGVKGDFIITLDTDSPSRYSKIKLMYVEIDGTLKEYDVTKINVRPKEENAIVHLSGIEDMTTAENYLKCEVYQPTANLPKLRGKKFYYHEIIGFTVVDKHLGELGPITNVYDLPKNVIAEFTYKEKAALFPLTELFIEKIDRKEKKFHVNLPEGLLDVYL